MNPTAKSGQYLARYAEPHSAALAAALLAHFGPVFRQAVVVPCCGEHATVNELLPSLARAAQSDADRKLALLVVNANPESAAHFRTNEELLADLGARARGLPAPRPLSVFDVNPNFSVAVIDRTRAPHFFTPDEGVGHARKIGADVACALGVEWIQNIDADCTVDADYFALPTGGNRRFTAGLLDTHVAYLHPFRHRRDDSRASRATTLYETYLDSYVAGLRSAGSPYAYHALGSIIAVTPAHYAAVRGFPRLRAAEDYYLLNKLAKTGRVVTLEHGAVWITPRFSDRVPFGTGASAIKIDERLERGQAGQRFHDPASYEALRVLLDEMHAFARHADLGRFRHQLFHACETRGLPAERVWTALETLHAVSALEKSVTSRTQEKSRAHHLSDWFDALKTLRFIHQLESTTKTAGDAPSPHFPHN